MGRTIIEKIIASHAAGEVTPGRIVDVAIDVRAARDFGGANVVGNLEKAGLGVDDPAKTFFTFDCNPGGSDQKYATNQHACRLFARRHGVRVFDVDAGIGTHLAIDEGLVGPGGTLVSTDSHANILGAVGAFGQGMGDQDVAHAFAYGRVWFRVPPTVKVVLEGMPPASVTAKDIVLSLVGRFGADGFLGMAVELYGPAVDALDLAGRITIASMGTEMGAIIVLIPPDEAVVAHCRAAGAAGVEPVFADGDARYEAVHRIDVSGLAPLAARPGRPDDVVPVADLAGTKIDSAFLGSCTNGRFEDLRAAAEILMGRHVAPGVVLKVVPATDRIWRRALEAGLMTVFKEAGALVGNAGCAGCAAGQIGQNGPREVTVSTGNRNFPGKQGKGSVYLASPETVAASAVAGALVTARAIPEEPAVFAAGGETARPAARVQAPAATGARPVSLRGRVWLVPRDSIDTDMIYHNRHLAVTDPKEMGQHAFGNLPGHEGFATNARPGDIVVAGSNFGCGSSRQQAVDCFQSLGVALLIARSFGAIYERNAINAAFPIMTADLVDAGLAEGDEIEVDLSTGRIVRIATGETFEGQAFSDVQMTIYLRGGLLAPTEG